MCIKQKTKTMKKIFTTLSLFLAVSATFAQVCPGSVTATCTPDATTPSASFKPDYTQFPCVTPGVDYSQSVSFKIPASVTQPQVADIDSVEFVSLEGLPCGLCWKIDRTSKRYNKNDVGCFLIQGNSSDAAGQYKLTITMNAWLQGSTTAVTNVQTDLAGLIHYVRVKDAQGNCPAVNTQGTNNTAATGCALNPVGIETLKTIKGINMMPNPLTSKATVSFESTVAGAYTFETIDVVGKVLASSVKEVTVGANNIEMNRAALPAGVYFLKIANGKSASTVKFVIAD